MKNSQLGFGIVGTGMIAGIIADAIDNSTNAKLIAVSSRKIDTAQSFVAKRQRVAAVQGIDDLLARADVDAVYIAIPTAPKEETAVAAMAAGKHVLVDKPFVNHSSLLRMTDAAAAKGVAFMDATHFVHHSRTAAIQAAGVEKIGSPRSLNTKFYFPLSDRSNIRYNEKLEPMGALGDLAWYSMRAVVEYLRPQGRITKVVTVAERDAETTSVVRASGLIAFDGGEVSTFDVGYTAGAVIMNPDIATGYFHRTGMANRKDVTFVPTPSNTSAQVAMIQTFAEVAAFGDAARRAAFAASSLKTQLYLDAIWAAADSRFTCPA
jgi:predicted dehydrogenase